MNVLLAVRTTTELETLVTQIDSLKKNLYLRGGQAIVIPEEIHADFDFAPDKSAFLDKVRESLLTARVLDLTVPLDLPDESIEKLTLWVKKYVGEDVVLGLKVDPKILAGATVTFAGHFKDYSFKNQLAEAVANMKD